MLVGYFIFDRVISLTWTPVDLTFALLPVSMHSAYGRRRLEAPIPLADHDPLDALTLPMPVDDALQSFVDEFVRSYVSSW